MTDTTTINDRVSQLIEMLKISPNAFATQLGVKTTLIYNLQKGRNKPSFDLLANIAETFKINPQWLLLGSGEIKVSHKVENNNKSDTTNDTLNHKEDNTVIHKNDHISSEIDLSNKLRENASKIYQLYQRLVDVRILLNQELKVKIGKLSEDNEVALLNELAQPGFYDIDDQSYFGYAWENLDFEAKRQFLLKQHGCIELFTESFFTCFDQLYKGIRIPLSRELAEEFLNNRAKITGQWKYKHVL